jgi:catechol 2,3-dioxygenase-like lactoylglutathione lyase family enzyme
MAGLKDFKVAAVLRAEDLDRARDYYANVLGLEEVASHEQVHQVMFVAGDGTALTIYERPGMPAPQNTALSFAVPANRFETLVAELRGRGVVFEDYDMPEIGLKTENGIANMRGAKAAWFLDSEGNIVSLNTM